MYLVHPQQTMNIEPVNETQPFGVFGHWPHLVISLVIQTGAMFVLADCNIF